MTNNEIFVEFLVLGMIIYHPLTEIEIFILCVINTERNLLCLSS